MGSDALLILRSRMLKEKEIAEVMGMEADWVRNNRILRNVIEDDNTEWISENNELEI